MRRLLRDKRRVMAGLLALAALALAAGALARSAAELAEPGGLSALPTVAQPPAPGALPGAPLPPISALPGRGAQPAEPARPAPGPQPSKGAAQPQVGLAAPSGEAAPTQRAAAARPATGASADLAASAAPWDRMVIRQASVALHVENVETALQRVREIARAGGGFVSSSSTHIEKVNDQERMVANMVIQVRPDAFDVAVQTLRQMALKVESENGTSQDVTEEYVDLESNLRNLQASEAAVLRLMDRATRIEDVLALQRELTSIRAQIERLQGRKRFLERRTEMATIAVSLRLPPLEVSRSPVKGRGWEPLAAAQRGWEASLAILRQVADGVIVALAFSWWLVPLVLLAAHVWQSRRGRSRAAPAAPPEA
ncbi:MAG: DUF4349 domain-containing protein [Chloroflexi bacterium]|nr:DUF4349 domain-containing protein [Chloroflexota bacterium]